MPITIDGDGTITGVSVGGLPDGIVDADMLAADAVTSAKIGSKTFTSYAIICDEKTENTNGGTFTSGAWRTRDLNTEIADPDSIVSISSNQFTLGAGSYFIEATAPAYDIDRHQTRLYNATSSSVVQAGSSQYAHTADNVQNNSIVMARVTVTSDTAFEIQHRSTANGTNNGFGVNTGFGEVCIYTLVKIFKEA